MELKNVLLSWYLFLKGLFHETGTGCNIVWWITSLNSYIKTVLEFLEIRVFSEKEETQFEKDTYGLLRLRRVL